MAQRSHRSMEDRHRDSIPRHRPRETVRDTNLVDVRDMGRIPRSPHGKSTGLPREVSHGTAKHKKEVFNDDFYAKFPWARGVDPFADTKTDWKPAEWYVQNKIKLGNGLLPDKIAEVPPATAFINGLISLELDDLKRDERSCAICLQPYRRGEFKEIPLQLPCGHVFGKACLLSWLSDIGSDAVHVACCPMCRNECVREKRRGLGTHEGLKQLLRDTNYILTGTRGLSLMREGRNDWEGVKAYVNGHLAEIEDAKRMRVRNFMRNLRRGLWDFPCTVVPESSKRSGREAVPLQMSMSQLLQELERQGVIASYLDVADGEFEGDEVDRIAGQLAKVIPAALLQYMDEVYAEKYMAVADDRR